ncbi:MAG: hypothetical protein O2960_16400 [Verrucomicrobia bacterium]|nr:hypothetical protein [Verrucomicrobiota bacterium]
MFDRNPASWQDRAALFRNFVAAFVESLMNVGHTSTKFPTKVELLWCHDTVIILVTSHALHGI